MPWSGDRQRLGLNSRSYTAMCRAIVQANPVCARCNEQISMELTVMARDKHSPYYQHPMAGTAGHILSVVTHPHLAKEPSNHQPEHRRCNSQDGNRIGRERKQKKGTPKQSRDW